MQDIVKRDLFPSAKKLVPGLAIAIVVGITAQFLSEHYGAPAMLMALLLGMAFQFVNEEEKFTPGIQFGSSTLLRIGVAFLGARISFELVSGLGISAILLVIGGVVATIVFGFGCARLLGRGWRFGLLTGGAVAICGASAAMAIAAVLPKNEHSERNLIFTVLSVTILSTLAMVLYPIIATYLELNTRETGIFLGGTIHDVAQVVGAGFSISDETGEVATVVKLIRVALLAPIVLCFSLLIRTFVKDVEQGGKKPPLVPFFVAAFLVLATLNSVGALPTSLATFLSDASRWMLLISIAAVGIKTSIKRMLEVGGQAIILVFAETVFIAVLILAAMRFVS